LVPLPALQVVDIVSVNDHRVELVFIDLLNWPTRARGERLPRVIDDQVNFARNGFRSLGVIT
jgi:hypothetical protein